MKKVKHFKQVCAEMEQRKKNLNEEVDIYVRLAEELRAYGAFVSFENKVVDFNNKIPTNLKDEYNTKFSQIYEHIQQPQWIAEMNQAYKEAQDEILVYIRQKGQCPEWVSHVQKNMEIQAQVNRIASIEYGEEIIKVLK